ncbi:hypothetical protein DSO57_1037067 [Entomophthora muscae]|uniref:Uncharacterized protein n=1 Tax=Entomophthora muscae TaxID=34485 RepID=A0ACC2SN50_9FUNG|nr:hypothetical protein DSO57_1037067 [Entomophthora muscae]
MNVFSDILDINLLLFKEGNLCHPHLLLNLLKGMGPEMASEPLFSSTGFEPGPSFDSVNTELFKTSFKLTLIQSLSSAQASSQSQFDNVNLNCLSVTLGNIGNIGEAGNILCLILGPLFAVPAGVEAKATSWSPPSVGLSTDSQSHA